MRTSSTSKHEIYKFVSIFVGHFFPPGSESVFRIRIRIQIHGSDWIRIRIRNTAWFIDMMVYRTTQVLLRWGLDQGFSVLPKSSNPNHIKEEIFFLITTFYAPKWDKISLKIYFLRPVSKFGEKIFFSGKLGLVFPVVGQRPSWTGSVSAQAEVCLGSCLGTMTTIPDICISMPGGVEALPAMTKAPMCKRR